MSSNLMFFFVTSSGSWYSTIAMTDGHFLIWPREISQSVCQRKTKIDHSMNLINLTLTLKLLVM